MVHGWSKLRLFSAFFSIGAVLIFCPPSWSAVHTQRGLLNNSPQIDEVFKGKEFFIERTPYAQWKPFEVFLIVRESKSNERAGAFDMEFVGRAAVIRKNASMVHLVAYKYLEGDHIEEGDRLLATGDPLTPDEMDLIRKEILGILKRDKEIEDYFQGLMSFKLGMYQATLQSTTESDTNSFKFANNILLMNMGFRWWFEFAPKVGVNFEFATASMPTTTFKRETVTSTQSYYNPGVMYRGRLLIIPTIYKVTYTINDFKTENPDDFLISSQYSGVTLGATFFLPWSITLLKIGWFSFSLSHLEIGGGFTPGVSVQEDTYSRGSAVDGNMMTAEGGIEFNFTIAPLKFTRNLFFVFEGGIQEYSLKFSGATSGTIPDTGESIPSDGTFRERQYWYGVRIKYNLPDLIGGLATGSL